jgi:arylformamidase
VDPREFPARFLAPTPALARKLAAGGIRLVGSDAPSMDEADSKTLDTHHIFADAGIATLENLVLSDVAPGEYTLLALPLKLVAADSAPVRAVLIEGKLE